MDGDKKGSEEEVKGEERRVVQTEEIRRIQPSSSPFFLSCTFSPPSSSFGTSKHQLQSLQLCPDVSQQSQRSCGTLQVFFFFPICFRLFSRVIRIPHFISS